MDHLYLVRHGIAADKVPEIDDRLRPLTAKGRRRFRKAARVFGRLAGRVDLICTSPLVRAVQTAEILAAEVRHGEVTVLEELLPDTPPPALLAALAPRAEGVRSIALVGHDPQISALLAQLSGVPLEQLDFKKGAAVRIDVSQLPEANDARPRWWVKPHAARRAKGIPLRKKEPAQKPPARASASKTRKPPPSRARQRARPRPQPRSDGQQRPQA